MLGEIRRRLLRQPFVPFTIFLADGRTLDIPHPEFLWLANIGRLYFMRDTDPFGERINSLLIVSIANTAAPEKAKQC